MAGPVKQITFDNYIQSPVGPIPKAGGQQTRLIFHLSYDFSSKEDDKSLNYHTPKHFCSVHYQDLEYAVQAVLQLKDEEWSREKQKKQLGNEEFTPVVVYFVKSDVQSAFRVVLLNKRSCTSKIMYLKGHYEGRKPHNWRYIIFFLDKCLPFGASINCALFQRVSDAIRHITQYKTGSDITNYLDDFLFLALTILRGSSLLTQFLELCNVRVCVDRPWL